MQTSSAVLQQHAQQERCQGVTCPAGLTQNESQHQELH